MNENTVEETNGGDGVEATTTFFYYINNFDTEAIRWFKIIFRDSLYLIENRFYSSKIIYNILIENNSDITYNYLKTRAFRETFNEYFKWKLNNAVNYPQIEFYEIDRPIVGR